MKVSKNKIEKLKKVIKEKKPKGFQKGHKHAKGNPKGVVTYDSEQLLLKSIDKVLVTNYITLNSHLTVSQMKKKLKDKNVSLLERGICKDLLNLGENGGTSTLGFFLDRLIGKAVQPIELSKKDPLKDLSPEELLEMKKELEASNRQSMTLLEQTHPRVKQQLHDYDEQLRDITNANKK